PGEFVLADGKARRATKRDALDGNSGSADDADRQKVDTAVIIAVREIRADLELVRTQVVSLPKLVRLLPFRSFAFTALAVEVAACRSLDQQFIWIATVGRHVGIKPLVAELRNQQGVGAYGVAMLDCRHVTALMEIWSRRLWREGVQAEVVELLRIQRE